MGWTHRVVHGLSTGAGPQSAHGAGGQAVGNATPRRALNSNFTALTGVEFRRAVYVNEPLDVLARTCWPNSWKLLIVTLTLAALESLFADGLVIDFSKPSEDNSVKSTLRQ